VDTAIEATLCSFGIYHWILLVMFLTILKLLLKHWYLMRLFGRTVLVILRQKSVVIRVVVVIVSLAVRFGACVARIETINGC
jgi:hypothetical protein